VGDILYSKHSLSLLILIEILQNLSQMLLFFWV